MRPRLLGFFTSSGVKVWPSMNSMTSTPGSACTTFGATPAAAAARLAASSFLRTTPCGSLSPPMRTTYFRPASSTTKLTFESPPRRSLGSTGSFHSGSAAACRQAAPIRRSSNCRCASAKAEPQLHSHRRGGHHSIGDHCDHRYPEPSHHPAPDIGLGERYVNLLSEVACPHQGSDD